MPGETRFGCQAEDSAASGYFRHRFPTIAAACIEIHTIPPGNSVHCYRCWLANGAARK
ncbi:MAG: hypothetical protein JNJ94_02465 [Chlorobi bacterium]|nr:hypothetical protein [Chlorobiota bacterium]